MFSGRESSAVALLAQATAGKLMAASHSGFVGAIVAVAYDISVIETPPEGRRPVKTYVGEYDEDLVRRALVREKERGGQAFFLHNRVESIDEVAERLRGLCPGLRFEVAHGQLDESDLESRMLAFLRGEDKDPETGESHLYHASCCLMFAANMVETRPDMDDRYKAPQ